MRTLYWFVFGVMFGFICGTFRVQLTAFIKSLFKKGTTP